MSDELTSDTLIAYIRGELPREQARPIAARAASDPEVRAEIAILRSLLGVPESPTDESASSFQAARNGHAAVLPLAGAAPPTPNGTIRDRTVGSSPQAPINLSAGTVGRALKWPRRRQVAMLGVVAAAALVMLGGVVLLTIGRVHGPQRAKDETVPPTWGAYSGPLLAMMNVAAGAQGQQPPSLLPSGGPAYKRPLEEVRKKWEEVRKKFGVDGSELSDEEARHLMASYVEDCRHQPSQSNLDWLNRLYRILLASHDKGNLDSALLRVAMGTAFDDFSRVHKKGSLEWRKAKTTALDYYREATTVFARCGAAWNNLAEIQIDLGEAKDVVENAKKAMRLKVGDSPNVLSARQHTLLKAYVLQARSQGQWRDQDLTDAKAVATKLVDSLKQREHRVRAEIVHQVILPLLEKQQIPSAADMDATEHEVPPLTNHPGGKS